MSEATAKRHMGLKTSRAITNTVIHVVLIAISIIWLIPFVCIVLQSFRVENTGPVGYVMPKVWGFDNYSKLLSFSRRIFPAGIRTPSSQPWPLPSCRRSSCCA